MQNNCSDIQKKVDCSFSKNSACIWNDDDDDCESYDLKKKIKWSKIMILLLIIFWLGTIIIDIYLILYLVKQTRDRKKKISPETIRRPGFIQDIPPSLRYLLIMVFLAAKIFIIVRLFESKNKLYEYEDSYLREDYLENGVVNYKGGEISKGIYSSFKNYSGAIGVTIFFGFPLCIFNGFLIMYDDDPVPEAKKGSTNVPDTRP